MKYFANSGFGDIVKINSRLHDNSGRCNISITLLSLPENKVKHLYVKENWLRLHRPATPLEIIRFKNAVKKY